jgi:cysteine desulfurase
MVYLDHAATSPLRPEAFAAMHPWLTERYGNPSGAHRVARAARAAIDDARDLIAGWLGVDPGGVIFTSGGTEADNLAVLGTVAARPGPVVITAIEHEAVARTAAAAGTEVRVVPVTPAGLIDLDALAGAVTRDVSLVSVMLVNNEVGTIQPLAQVLDVVRRRAPAAALHTDAVQAAAWLDVATAAAGSDLISVSAHKFGGPQGVGVLAWRERRGAPLLHAILHGGGQERERRSGTHNVAGIIGMAAAWEATMAGRVANAARVGALRDRLVDELVAGVPGAIETGDRAAKIPGNAHCCFEGLESEALVVLLDEAGVCASAGSACASGATEPSHVLAAMGIPVEFAAGALRCSLGATTTSADIDLALKVIPDAIAQLRGGYS